MGDMNQLLHIEKFKSSFKGPFLEVGSKDYGSTQDLRSIFSDDTYVGVDMAHGPGVDVALDLTQPFDEIDGELKGQRFSTIFCLSVLEHCKDPFTMARNMTSLLQPNGTMIVSVPFAWKIHGYPNDYWRFTPEGIKVLFPTIEFKTELSTGSTSKPKDFQPLDNDFGRICFNMSKHAKNGRPLRGLSAKFLKVLSKVGIFSWLTGYRYLYAPTNVIMIGNKK